MTISTEELAVEKKLVVVFDICSSSNILEDLMLSDNLVAMRTLIIRTKKFLRRQSHKNRFEVYKFIGDGWILLFSPDVRGEIFVDFLEELCRQFSRGLKTRILPRLQTIPSVMGLTFGVDRGKLVRIRMMGQTEYIGRPLNIASRLQGAIKEKDKNPAYKVLFSKPSYNALGLPKSSRGVQAVTRTLRNIQGGNKYACIKLTLRSQAATSELRAFRSKRASISVMETPLTSIAGIPITTVYAGVEDLVPATVKLLSDHTFETAVRYLARGKRAQTIELIRGDSGLSLARCKTIVDRLEKAVDRMTDKKV